MSSPFDQPPFRTSIQPPAPADSVDALGDADALSDELTDDLTADAIEAAYQRALEAGAGAAQELGFATGGEAGSGLLDVRDKTESEETAHAPDQSAADDDSDSEDTFIEEGPPVTPRQVLGALLFVGGEPLTGKRLADLLGGGFTHEQVDDLLEELNHQYADESRPYEIRLGEGGYRLLLRLEFERIRHRVYGLGPKDVKLSQDALEILALVAYRQPISKSEVEETGKSNAAAVLRQLLRRELIALERTGEGKGEGDVAYQTTQRFLQLFGLTNLSDLPYAEDLAFK